MPKGGATRPSDNIDLQRAKSALRDIIQFLELEFHNLGFALDISKSQKEQMDAYVVKKLDVARDMMGRLGDAGLDVDDEYRRLAQRSQELIDRIDRDYDVVEDGGKRRRKTKRSKKTMKRK